MLPWAAMTQPLEGAHLWQGADAFDNTTAWIHEGGAVASESLMRRIDPEADLFTLWRRLVDVTAQTEGGFTADGYFSWNNAKPIHAEPWRLPSS